MTITKAVEMYLSAAWTDVSADVLAGSVSMTRGIQASGPLDHVASTGRLSLAMNNSASNSGSKLGYYSPEHANARTDFDIGAGARLKFTRSGTTKYLYTGKIIDIDVLPGQYKERRTLVECADFIDHMMEERLDKLAVQADKRPDQVLSTVITAMNHTPTNTSYETDPDTYTRALHTERDEKTSPATVANKLALSSFGYIYVKGNDTDGELLKYEDRHTRIKNDTSVATFSNTMTGLKVNRRKQDIYNKVTGFAYTVEVVADAVLYELQREIMIPAMQTTTFSVNFTDPTGAGRRVSAENVDTLTADTHYKFSSVSGSGNDKNGDLDLSASTIGANSIEVVAENTSSVSGYLWFFEPTGDALLLYDPLEYSTEDSTSIAAYGLRELRVDSIYQDDYNTIKDICDYLLANYKDPHNEIESIEYIANGTTLETAFMAVDIGSRITVVETMNAISADYFVQGMQVDILTSGFIKVRYNLTKATSSAFWFLGDTGFSELGETTYLGW